MAGWASSTSASATPQGTGSTSPPLERNRTSALIHCTEFSPTEWSEKYSLILDFKQSYADWIESPIFNILRFEIKHSAILFIFREGGGWIYKEKLIVSFICKYAQKYVLNAIYVVQFQAGFEEVRATLLYSISAYCTPVHTSWHVQS